MEKQVSLERSKIFHLENSMVMYDIYNSEMIKKLINTIQHLHNKTTWSETLFVGKINNWYQWYLSEEGAIHYVINSILYMTTLREKYIKLYKKFMDQLKMSANVMSSLKRITYQFLFCPQWS